MTFNDAIRILKKQITDCDSMFFLFESWFDTTLEHIDRICGGTSIQYMNFMFMRSEYKTSKIGQSTNEIQRLEKTYKYRAKQQLNGIIEQLEEDQRQANLKQKEEQQRLAIKQNQEEQEKKQQKIDEETKSLPKQLIPEKQPPKKIFYNNGKTYTIGISLFWTVAIPFISIIATGAYFIGNTKYDVDKNKLLEDNSSLRFQTNTYEQRHFKDSIKTDSLNREVIRLDSLSKSFSH